MSEVAVIGAAGYLGSAICHALAREFTVRRLVRRPAGPRDVRYDFWLDGLERTLADVDAVVFTARVHPVSRVDDREVRREYADRIRRLARASLGRPLVVVSTHEVFGGDRGAYSEAETPKPSTASGRCARLLEEAVAEHADRWCVLRPSSIYGFSPTGLDERLAAAIEAIKSRTPFDVHPGVFRNPIAVDDVAATIRALVRRDLRGVVHAGGPRSSDAHFVAAALTALGYPTDRLRPRPLPAADTTMQVRRLLEETPVVPRSVEAALSPRPRRTAAA